MLIFFFLFTHLSFTSSGFLDQTSRHGGADRKTLEEASCRVTETKCHQLLQQNGDKDARM